MTATGHAVIGTVIAATIGIPIIAIPIAVLSHTLADLVPHWDAGTNMKEKTHQRFFFDSAVDVILSYIVSYLLVIFLFPQTSIIYAFIMVFAAQFFDWLMIPYLYLNLKNPIFKAFVNFQGMFNSRLDKPWGIVTQVIVCSGLVILAKAL
ncbi:MAG TPA: hypothetical protein VMR41_00450 [Patescibacteria group bacterium]|nr:hypothetical protein [Patescibacteria group bacterium]